MEHSDTITLGTLVILVVPFKVNIFL
jgi:hypothetical protein